MSSQPGEEALNQSSKKLLNWVFTWPKMLFVIVILGLLVRFAFSGMRVFVSPDSMAYWFTTQALLSGDWMNTYIERTPGYPAFLMLVQGVTSVIAGFFGQALTQDNFQRGLIIAQSLLGISNACLVASITRQALNFKTNQQTAEQEIEAEQTIQNDDREYACRLSDISAQWWAFLAGLLTLFLPDLLLYEHAFLTETLYTTLLLCWVLAFQYLSINRIKQWWKILAFAALTAALILVKPVAISVAICGAVWLFFTQQKKWLSLGIYGVTIASLLLPWMMFNANVHGKFTLAAGQGANQLYKMIDSVDWDSPLASGYKLRLHQRYMIHPEGQTYNAVNDVHVLMDQEASRKPNYSAIYLQHDADAGLLAWEAVLKNPVAWVYQTGKQFVDFFLKPQAPIVTLPLFSLWAVISQNVWKILLLITVLGSCFFIREKSTAYRNTMLMATALVIAHAILYPITTLADARYHIPLEPVMLLVSMLWLQQLVINPSRHQDRQMNKLALDS